MATSVLRVKRPGLHAPPDEGLVATDGGFDERAFAIAGGGLPLHSAVFADCAAVLVPLAGRSIAGRFDRVGARRNDDHGIGAVVADRIVGRLSVIGAIGGEPFDRTTDLAEQWLHLRCVTRLLLVIVWAMTSPLSASRAKWSLRHR